LLRIGIYVDWYEESTCFSTLSTELSYFYSPSPFISPHPPTSSQEKDEEKERHLIKNVLFPAFKQYLVPNDSLLAGQGNDGGDAVVLLTRLESLYKVFERC